MIKRTLLAVMIFAAPFASAATANALGDENLVPLSQDTAELTDVAGTDSDNRDSASDKPGDSGQTSPEEKRWIGIVTLQSGNLNVRSGPSLEHEIIGKLPNGSVVSVLEQFEEWVSIPYGSGIAYISKPYVRLKQTETLKPSGNSAKVIVLDPGHGGRDPGATLKDGTKESDIVWNYAEKAKASLEQAGYEVHLTRSKDSSCTEYKRNEEDLACRVDLVKKVGADLFISIHADANPVQSFRGTVTFYNARNDFDSNQNPYPEESKLLAELVQSHVQPAMGSRDRGTANKNYYVNRMSSVPSVLVELAVLTNSNDLKLLKSSKRQEAFADALVKAIDSYFNPGGSKDL